MGHYDEQYDEMYERMASNQKGLDDAFNEKVDTAINCFRGYENLPEVKVAVTYLKGLRR